MKMANPISFDRCALFRTPSPKKLAELLQVSEVEMEELANQGSLAYRKVFPVKGRLIETPEAPLKRVQKRIHKLLGKIAPPDYLFSAYKKRGSVSNAAFHLDNVDGWILKLDLRQFYPSSDGSLVRSFFTEDMGCPLDVATILMKLCIVRDTEVAAHRHLPTGGVTSPILSYLCYWRMFEDLNNLAHLNNAKFSIFADDITISGLSKGHGVTKQAIQIINCYKLRVNFKKIRNYRPNQREKIITGVVLTPKGLKLPTQRKAKLTELRADLKHPCKPSRANKKFERLHGALSSCGQIEPRFKSAANKLLKKWKNTEAWKVRNSSLPSKAPKPLETA